MQVLPPPEDQRVSGKEVQVEGTSLAKCFALKLSLQSRLFPCMGFLQGPPHAGECSIVAKTNSDR